ncbi:MAG: SUMF1/EgtB/PvdO family nonheme iron enzyme [Chloroflexi bacterium]|nr:SUMF1/EgtB/PvdO family nonheme iron enzyme [Chloroflexota bacterium]
MSDVFISYSRKNGDFARHLIEQLQAHKKSAWIDWEGIPLTSPNWWADIRSGIEAADSFLFIMSPASMASIVCNLELDYALELKKRIVPILYQDIVSRDAFATIADFEPDAAMQERLSGKDPLIIARDNWHQLNHINWVFFRQDDNFQEGLKRLTTAIETDLEYVKAHTRYLTRATEWEHAGEREDLLLYGKDIDGAEVWLRQADAYAAAADGAKTDVVNPLPQALQRRFIRVSREAADRRAAQLIALEAGRRQARNNLRRVIGIGSAVGAIAIAVIAAAVLVQQTQEANAIADAMGEMAELPTFTIVSASGESIAIPAFMIHRHEVSYRQYRLCDQYGPCDPPVHTWPADGGLEYDYTSAPDEYPVQSVTAGEATAFCDWIGARLPSAFEWQYAAQGEDKHPFPWGDDLPDQTSVRVNMFVEGKGDSAGHPVAVDDRDYAGSASLEGGIMHLLGNVREWTSTPVDCDGLCLTTWEITQPSPGSLQVMGHSFWTGSLSERVLRTSPDSILFDDAAAPDYPDETIGFRCAKSR